MLLLVTILLLRSIVELIKPGLLWHHVHTLWTSIARYLWLHILLLLSILLLQSLLIEIVETLTRRCNLWLESVRVLKARHLRL